MLTCSIDKALQSSWIVKAKVKLNVRTALGPINKYLHIAKVLDRVRVRNGIQMKLGPKPSNKY